MLTDEDLDRVSVMGELIRTMTDAYRSGLVDKQTADQHVSMYARVIHDTMFAATKKEAMT